MASPRYSTQLRILEYQSGEVSTTLTICLAFSSTARSFGSESIKLPFTFRERSLFSSYRATDDASKLSKYFLPKNFQEQASDELYSEEDMRVKWSSSWSAVSDISQKESPEYISLAEYCRPAQFCQGLGED